MVLPEPEGPIIATKSPSSMPMLRPSKIVIDSLPTSATAIAEVVFPMSAWGETNGTTTNVEGRVMTLRQRVTATGTSRDDWQIAADLADRLNIDLGIDTVDDAVGLMASTIPSRAAITVEADRQYPGHLSGLHLRGW